MEASLLLPGLLYPCPPLPPHAPGSFRSRTRGALRTLTWIPPTIFSSLRNLPCEARDLFDPASPPVLPSLLPMGPSASLFLPSFPCPRSLPSLRSSASAWSPRAAERVPTDRLSGWPHDKVPRRQDQREPPSPRCLDTTPPRSRPQLPPLPSPHTRPGIKRGKLTSEEAR